MIRQATPADIAALVEVSIEALSIDPYPELVISRERVYQSVKECVCSSMNFAWVSEVDGKINGGLGAIVVPLMFHERSQALVLAWYCRDQGGDGIRLMRKFMEWVKTRPMIKQVCFSMDRNFNSKIGDMAMRVGFTEVLPMYMLTR